MPFAVERSREADRIISAMQTAAEQNPQGAQAVVWRQVDRILGKVLTTDDALERTHGLRPPLSNVFRIKFGRARIFYIASSKTQRLVVLFIGYRKRGDKNDAYEDFTRQLKRGSWDHWFKELGVTKPAG